MKKQIIKWLSNLMNLKSATIKNAMSFKLVMLTKIVAFKNFLIIYQGKITSLKKLK